MATTTPRTVPLVRRLFKEAGVVITRGSTRDNVQHLPPEFIDGVNTLYAGTRWGRQELDGELIEDVAGALDGMRVRNVATGSDLVWTGTQWKVPPVMAAPQSGAVIDIEARTVIEALLVYFRAIGLLAP